MRTQPKINFYYWITLMAASIFGCNTGDFVADTLHVGHLAGLPWLAVALVILFALERFTAFTAPIFFWLIVIVVRTAATNVADSIYDFTGSYEAGFSFGVPVCMAILSAAVWAYIRWDVDTSTNKLGVSVTPLFWICMFLAGALGTVGGDFISFGLGLWPTGTFVLMGAISVLFIYRGRNRLSLHPVYYWATVLLIRTAGTGGGDALAHGFFNKSSATLVSGMVFVGLVIWGYILNRRNQPLERQKFN